MRPLETPLKVLLASRDSYRMMSARRTPLSPVCASNGSASFAFRQKLAGPARTRSSGAHESADRGRRQQSASLEREKENANEMFATNSGQLSHKKRTTTVRTGDKKDPTLLRARDFCFPLNAFSDL